MGYEKPGEIIFSLCERSNCDTHHKITNFYKTIKILANLDPFCWMGDDLSCEAPAGGTLADGGC